MTRIITIVTAIQLAAVAACVAVGADAAFSPVKYNATGESSPGLFTHRDDALTFLRLLSLGRLSVDGYVADVRSPADCADVYARLAKGGAFPITQFDWTRLD